MILTKNHGACIKPPRQRFCQFLFGFVSKCEAFVPRICAFGQGCCDGMVDTAIDCWRMKEKFAWRRYLRRSVKIGVRSDIRPNSTSDGWVRVRMSDLTPKPRMSDLTPKPDRPRSLTPKPDPEAGFSAKRRGSGDRQKKAARRPLSDPTCCQVSIRRTCTVRRT